MKDYGTNNYGTNKESDFHSFASNNYLSVVKAAPNMTSPPNNQEF